MQSLFPRSRETRKPKVAEILKYKDELDKKFLFLTKAPVQDADGNPTVIRFSRKNKELFVMTEVDAKATGWSAHWVKGKWVEEQKKTSKKTSKKASS